MDYRASLFIILSVGSSCAQNHVIKPLKLLAAESALPLVAQDLFIQLPEPCQKSLVQAYYLQQGFIECPSLVTTDESLYIKKTDIVEFRSNRYCTQAHNRPTRHPQNPFILEPTPEEPIRFAYTYKEKEIPLGRRDRVLFQGKRIHYTKLPDYQAGMEILDEDKWIAFQTEFEEDRLMDHVTKKNGSPYNDFINDESIRTVVGPNKRNLVISFMDNEGKLRVGQFQNRDFDRHLDEEHAKIGLDPNDPVTALALDHGEMDNPLELCELVDFQIKTKEERHIKAFEIYKVQLQKHSIWFGTKFGRVYWHEFARGLATLCNQGQEDPQITTQELPVQLRGPIKDLQVNKNNTRLWILDAQAFYSFDLVKKEQQVICRLPELQDQEDAIITQDADVEALLEAERFLCSTISPCEQYALLGGSKGSVVLVDIAQKNCHIIERIPGYPILDTWWSNKNQIVILSRSRTVKSFKVELRNSTNYQSSITNICMSNQVTHEE